MVSVIIPALNEESALAGTLESVRTAKGHFEIIVVDGQSTDTTAGIASRYGRTLSAPPHRGLQMNRGAEQARGEVLLFLHADVIFPPGGFLAIEEALADPRVVGGNFDLSFDGKSAVSCIFTRINRWRRHFGVFYGDSGIFVRREVFARLGGYRVIPLMEDYDFARRLVKSGRTVFLQEKLLVSARRWEEYGVFRTMASWFFLHTLYYLGVPPATLARYYPPVRRHVALAEQAAAQQPRASGP